MKKHVKIILTYTFVIIAIVLVVSQLFKLMNPQEPLKYSRVIQYFEDNQVVKFNVDDKNLLTMTVKEGETTKEISYKLKYLQFLREDIKPYIENPETNIVEYEFEPENVVPIWVSFVPYLVVIGLFVLLWFYMMNQAAGGKGSKINSFGKARIKIPSTDKNKVMFRDVAGADEEKAELQEVVDFLKDPARYTKLGARIPHGVLLVGPPGTGKTLLAKAVAGEANVPFLSISGSDFVEMYVGVGASRVRDLFETARKAPASIIFIDEIDAVGRHRGAGLGGGHDEREQTLNQLLVEMDGFGSHEGIIVIAATNRRDILDPALLRPGRFDRQVTVGYPDIKGREEILKVHSRNKPFSSDVELEKVAKTTVGFTGADLANLLNESALLAARRRKNLISMDDIEDAFIKIIAGPQKKSMKIKAEEKRKTAYHEAGHAVLAFVLPNLDPVQQISIIPSGNALGYTLNPPVEDKYSVYRQGLKEEIAMLLGGRAAEKVVFDDISGGASNDIMRATAMAKNMVKKLGMSDALGPISFGSDQNEVFLGRDFSNSPDYSEQIAAKIDAEVHAIIDEAYELALKIVRENIGKLDIIAEYLLKNEIMDGDQFKAIMEGSPTIEDLETMLEEKKTKRKLEGEERDRVDKAREKREAEERKSAAQQNNEQHGENHNNKSENNKH